MTVNGPEAVSPIPGATRITAQALTRLAAAVAGSVLRAPAADIRVSVRDHRQELALDVQAPLPLDRLDSDAPGTSETVIERTERARRDLAERFQALSGRSVSAVTLTLTTGIVTKRRRIL